MSKDYRTSVKEFRNYLEESLPSLFPREKVAELTGGIISYRTMANIDFRKVGPPTIKVGRKVCYPKADFIEWAVNFYIHNDSDND